MDALFAFDNAVERLLEVSPVEALPEQLATLRFLFEYEFDKLACSEEMSVETLARPLDVEVNALRFRSSRAT